MVRIAPVGPVLPVDEQEWRDVPHVLHVGARSVAESKDTFSVSLLGRRLQLLDPDLGSSVGGSPHDELEFEHLLQMLEERLASIRERVLLSAGHVSYGLLLELWQVNEVLCRMLPIWVQCVRPAWRAMCRPRFAALFGICHFLLPVMSKAGEPHEWLALQFALRQREQAFV